MTSRSTSIGENYIKWSTFTHLQSYLSNDTSVDNNKVYANQNAQYQRDWVKIENRETQK